MWATAGGTAVPTVGVTGADVAISGGNSVAGGSTTESWTKDGAVSTPCPGRTGTTGSAVPVTTGIGGGSARVVPTRSASEEFKPSFRAEGWLPLALLPSVTTGGAEVTLSPVTADRIGGADPKTVSGAVGGTDNPTTGAMNGVENPMAGRFFNRVSSTPSE